MNADLLLSLTLFAFVASATPGPNTLMLLASGANFGVLRSVPHMAGITLGFTVMIALVGIGLMGVFERLPAADSALKVLAVLYMLWLAWKIAGAAAPGEATSTSHPLTFLQAAGFQWVNPKAWAMGTSAIALYAPDRSLAGVLVVAGAFFLVSFPAVTGWTVLGHEIRRFLGTPARLRAFNWTMAALLLASLVPLLRL
ncbi:Transporter, LysE family [Candidatus Rhodobacter oscarellae]|uniref:Transporter, LysE family n=1 Tax=Candidatus Rhodobacter oscarellae TaxID=1675527 RepID=A0A0J9GXN1_9RHOB|nr:LysE family translocator [Candidatus Rhodobacter lobularis]KMW58238.1 Transporter, LysE family [Candidatus Rhodobacter lobularis]